jgi:hypothetical protein
MAAGLDEIIKVDGVIGNNFLVSCHIVIAYPEDI